MPKLFTQNTSTASTESLEILLMVKDFWAGTERGSKPKIPGSPSVLVDAILASEICHF